MLILAFFGALVALFGDNLPPRLKARALAVQGDDRLCLPRSSRCSPPIPSRALSPAPLEGQELNPLLQDPGLALHPPMLYLGYVGFSMTFSFAVAALIEGRVDAAWARWVRPWTLLAWIYAHRRHRAGRALGLLRTGLGRLVVLGSGRERLLHALAGGHRACCIAAIVVEKRDALKAWTLLLAILAFGFCLLGTFLVRSGVITSVHAFAQDPARGLFILGILGLALGGSFALFAWRAPQLNAGGLFAPISREGALVLNNLLLGDGAGDGAPGHALSAGARRSWAAAPVSVGAPYYIATFVPLDDAAGRCLMAVGPLLGWKRGDLPGALQRLSVAGVLAVFAAGVCALSREFGASWLAPLGVGARRLAVHRHLDRMDRARRSCSACSLARELASRPASAARAPMA